MGYSDYPRRLRAWLVRLAGLWPAARRESELADDIEAHLQMHIDDNVRSGMHPEHARRDAILKLGGVGPVKDAYRDRRTIPLLENLMRDTRLAIRQLRKNPGFAWTAMLVLGLGMCASAALFAFVDARTCTVRRHGWWERSRPWHCCSAWSGSMVWWPIR
jgi:macrolide transport system ATP-binding/permease protein